MDSGAQRHRRAHHEVGDDANNNIRWMQESCILYYPWMRVTVTHCGQAVLNKVWIPRSQVYGVRKVKDCLNTMLARASALKQVQEDGMGFPSFHCLSIL